MATANRNYKDGVFVDYLRDPQRAIEVYNAIAGKNYPQTANIEFRTLENVLNRTYNNDLAFIIEGRAVVMIEHQSSINENMALRMLIYIGEVYKWHVSQRDLYRRSARPIPTPEFFVIYNGRENYPDKKVIRLSDAFILKNNEPQLELTVPVYNIAKGHNSELLKHSKSLADYSMLISLVNDELAKGISLDIAIDKVIKYCIGNGIMTEYLENNGEVRRMLSMQWDEDLFIEVTKEEGREEGIAEARLEVARNLKVAGIEKVLVLKTTGISEEEYDAL